MTNTVDKVSNCVENALPNRPILADDPVKIFRISEHAPEGVCNEFLLHIGFIQIPVTLGSGIKRAVIPFIAQTVNHQTRHCTVRLRICLPDTVYDLVCERHAGRVLCIPRNFNGAVVIAGVRHAKKISVFVIGRDFIHNPNRHARSLCQRVQRALCFGSVVRLPVGLVFYKPQFCGLFGSRRAVIRNARLVGRSSEIGRHTVDLVRLLRRDLAGGGVVGCHKAVVEIRQRFRRRVLRRLAKRRRTFPAKGVRHFFHLQHRRLPFSSSQTPLCCAGLAPGIRSALLLVLSPRNLRFAGAPKAPLEGSCRRRRLRGVHLA